ncbi:putative sodium/metabolite cotransporter BASS4, chloroplastic [Tetrabaena socialis]|uniref:Putative sodium/metabolite cotransporter BASS4, chloroplastic n=1 Tax=Tetrabaena socialis TaxID=47790 RepID=A0A2J8A9P3_9CHLO|nr:putative sodium/metabolite cotransporter BASS4, chloroplastic [Tetrabaena socialis]|eukprot:PNH09242.1 putative sodium/metabolite cotransporter BASS4, chloroplastic [Tetrabaena socialis]
MKQISNPETLAEPLRLTIFCVAPTTLGVGVALTSACGGNEAVALLLTVGTNMLAVLTMPPELRLLLPPSRRHVEGGGSSGGGSVNVADLLIKLLITVVAPVIIGKMATRPHDGTVVLCPDTLRYRIGLAHVRARESRAKGLVRLR